MKNPMEATSCGSGRLKKPGKTYRLARVQSLNVKPTSPPPLGRLRFFFVPTIIVYIHPRSIIHIPVYSVLTIYIDIYIYYMYVCVCNFFPKVCVIIIHTSFAKHDYEIYIYFRSFVFFFLYSIVL